MIENRAAMNSGESSEVCGECRHANHGTEDAAEGFWACPWVGSTMADSRCRIRYRATGKAVFEPFDGGNCTWGTGDPVFRSTPSGYEDREIELRDN